MDNRPEQELAKQVETALNSFSFNPKLFAAEIPTMHRTLQQSLWRLIKECVKVIADEKTGHETATWLHTWRQRRYLNT